MSRPPRKPGELGNPRPVQHRGEWRTRARVRDTSGKPIDLEAYGPTPEDSLQKLRAKADAVWHNAFTSLTAETTMAELSRMWLADKAQLPPSKAVVEASLRGYTSSVENGVIPYMGAIRVGDVTPTLLGKLLDRIEKERSSSYRVAIRKVLSMMLGYAVAEGAISFNPVKQLPREHLARRDRLRLNAMQALLVLQMIRVWSGVNPERRGGRRRDMSIHADVLTVMLGSSIRPGEVLALRREDIVGTTDEGQLIVEICGTIKSDKGRHAYRQHWTKHKKQRRRIVLPEFAAEVIRRRIAAYRPNPDKVIFTSATNTNVSVTKIDKGLRDFDAHNREVLQDLGIAKGELVPYTMRRTVASVVSDEGGLSLAQQLLGHTFESTTAGYVFHEIKLVDPATASILERWFSANAPLPHGEQPHTGQERGPGVDQP